eukprot:1160136-Pelagomonas_calceolata.AAC.14
MKHMMQSKVDSSARALVEGASLPKCINPLLICMGVCLFMQEQMEHMMQSKGDSSVSALVEEAFLPNLEEELEALEEETDGFAQGLTGCDNVCWNVCKGGRLREDTKSTDKTRQAASRADIDQMLAWGINVVAVFLMLPLVYWLGRQLEAMKKEEAGGLPHRQLEALKKEEAGSLTHCKSDACVGNQYFGCVYDAASCVLDGKTVGGTEEGRGSQHPAQLTVPIGAFKSLNFRQTVVGQRRSGGDHSRPGTPTAFMRTVPLAPRGWSLFVSAVTQSAKGQNLFSRPIVCILLEHGHVHCSYAVV